MKYRFASKEKTLSFGVFPEVPLSEATEKRDEARKSLRDDSIQNKVLRLAACTSLRKLRYLMSIHACIYLYMLITLCKFG